MSIENSGCVTSKYFSGQSAMDESLSDFQEAKKSCKGPKPAQKPNKPKTRKVTKHIKGQKDIRTALKEKKNDLISYSKEFDTVCKKSGLDVDSEQLQLAIALSKSLQTESNNNPESSQALSSQQRVAKIRKTLQEYGFKVPAAKVTVNKRTRKTRKHYKLLATSEEEKHKIIAKKYSKIIFENLYDSRLTYDKSDNHNANARVYFISTNMPYNSMKDNNVFYVEDLVEKSTTCGSLLRDWSEIPGRPESPKLSIGTMNFKDINCSQDELDVVLSGSFKSLKSIIATKEIKFKECDVPKIVLDDHESTLSENKAQFQTKKPVKQSIEIETPDSKGFSTKSPVKVLSPDNEVIEIKSPIKEVLVNRKLFEEDLTSKETNNELTTYTQQCRSCSPDIFDDDFSSIMDNTKHINVLSQEHKTKVFTEDNFMDLTQCANVLSQNNNNNSQLSQNLTKRKSNDFMEITECIVGSSQPIREEVKEIDLTQSPEDNIAPVEENPVIKNYPDLDLAYTNVVEQNTNAGTSQNITDICNETVLTVHKENVDNIEIANDNIDLTQSSNEDDKRVTIEKNNQIPDEKIYNMDLTQSSNSTDFDDLPIIDVANSQTQKSLDDTIIINKEDYIDNGIIKKSMIFETDLDNVFDLTQAQDVSKEYNSSSVEESKEYCASFYEDFVHDHSENTEITENNQDDGKNSTLCKELDDIDLTQASDTSEEQNITTGLVKAFENIPNKSSLGKKDDVSIDYDEILIDDDPINRGSFKESEKSNSIDLKNDFTKPEVYNDVEIVYTNDADINSSQNSEVFNISDKELDYSLHKSRQYDFRRDEFDIGGLSVIDNITKLGSFRKSLSEGCSSIKTTNKNMTIDDSFLPEVNIKKSDNILSKTLLIDADNPAVSSPIKVHEVLSSNDGIFNIKTPEKTEYVIKMNDVTPMADYETMSTPQRNRELDKYGIKPLKRKRAIKILTHIYNQMHPTLQHILDEDQQPPSKKPRQELPTQMSSPNKPINSPLHSPLKKTPVKLHSPLKTNEIELYPSPKRTETLKRDRNTLSTPSPKKTEQLKRDRDIFSSPSPKKTKHLKRDRNILSMPSPEKIGELKRDRNILSLPSPKKIEQLIRDENILCMASPKNTDGLKDVNCYEVTSEVAVIKSVDCSPDDWVFQKREKAKVHSCRVPLHIAFHNYVLSRRSLREAILKYEPVNIDVIHKDLVGYGHRYDPKDLLKFLDKKCITVKTTDNSSRNNKR